MSAVSVFTCLNCHVAFPDGEIQRLHYKSDWHRYNLKRKVAELPPVSADRFRELVLLQQPSSSQSAQSLHCQPCKKTFHSQPQHLNHVRSRRHVETERRWLADEQLREERRQLAEMNSKNDELSGVSEKAAVTRGLRSRPSPKAARRVAAVSSSAADMGEGDDDCESVDSEEWSAWSGEPLPCTACLFCPHECGSLSASLRHMTAAHSFFVPDLDYVSDLHALIGYLGEKVGVGFVCLWCNERGRHFYSVEAVQKHMRDKGHTKMLHEGEVLAEYAEFYDYSSTYPDQEEDRQDDEADDLQLVDADEYQLVLPSGAVIGHRSLARYYRQRLKPEKAVAISRSGAATTARDVLHQYRLMGWTAATKQQVQKTARDMQVLHRVRQKHSMQLGVKANKLQQHFRQQCPI